MATRSPLIQACSKDKKYLGRAETVQAPSLPFEKPFDDMRDLPDPRAYPKHLDRDLPTSPNEGPLPKNAYSKVKEQNNPRPWPVSDKDGTSSKRKRDTHSFPLSPHHQNEYNQLDRWLDEPDRTGPYHAIDSVVPTKKSSYVNKATNKKA